ncbi:MAG: hypothetical protein WB721_20160, partial [Pseudolabrys sp.]
MSDRLSLSQVAALMAYAATRAGGQLLFKLGASGSPAFCSMGNFFSRLHLHLRRRLAAEPSSMMARPTRQVPLP